MDQVNRFKLSWALFKSSVSVMFRNKTLLVFPVVIAFLTSAIALFFLCPVAVAFAAERYHPPIFHKALVWVTAHHWIDGVRAQNFYHWLRADHWQNAKPIASGYFVVTYFFSVLAATFFNVAFYHEIMQALRGRDVSIGNGLKFALTRWKAVLLWSAFAGVIGYLIRALEQRLGLFGRIVTGIIGTTWSVACVFVVPVIVMDDTIWNPVTALKRSVTALKRTWGEALIEYAGIKLSNAVVTIGALVWLGLLIFTAYKLHNMVLAAVAVAGGIIPIAAFYYLSSVANQVFRCALYLYASTGSMPYPFKPEMTAVAWKTKN